jgi:hypothetical protein
MSTAKVVRSALKLSAVQQGLCVALALVAIGMLSACDPPLDMSSQAAANNDALAAPESAAKLFKPS